LGTSCWGTPPLNHIATEFSERLGEAIQEASEPEIRVLLIRAEGPNFSQGGDILDFIDMEFNAWRTFISDMHHSYRKIEPLQIPTVCAVRGRAWGGAFELTLACDFIVAAENASFRCIEPSVGTAPVCGGVQWIAERAGPARAARYVMLSEEMSGATAGEFGIAAYVVPRRYPCRSSWPARRPASRRPRWISTRPVPGTAPSRARRRPSA